MKKILIGILICLGFFTSLGFGQKIQVELYHGQNEGVKNDVPVEHPLRKSLDKLIGYKMYEKLGSAQCQLEMGYDQWLLPNKIFFLRIARIGIARAKLELFQEKKSIIQSEFDPKRKKPLLITGPLYANGQLVLILTTEY